MSHIFGEVRQIAFVVLDIDEAMDYWAKTLGIAPFFIKRKIKLSKFTYRGTQQESPVISIALANSGSLQIELIQQHDEMPSLYLEFLTSGRIGLQHISSWVTQHEFDTRREQLLKSGFSLAQEGNIASSGVRLAYFDTEKNGQGIIFEMADLKEPEQYARVMNIAEKAEKWSGGEHIIEVAA